MTHLHLCNKSKYNRLHNQLFNNNKLTKKYPNKYKDNNLLVYPLLHSGMNH